MTQVCLIRHGQTEWNAIGRLQGRDDIPLNEIGKQQAEKCGAFLKDEKWDFIISSPLSRARETADIILRQIGPHPFVIMEEFIERDFGDGSGKTKEERRLLYPGKIYPNQETWEVFTERLQKGIQILNETYPAKKILIVAHGAVINAILATISNGKIGSGKTKLLNACLSSIQFENDKWKIHHYNQVHHLR